MGGPLPGWKAVLLGAAISALAGVAAALAQFLLAWFHIVPSLP